MKPRVVLVSVLLMTCCCNLLKADDAVFSSISEVVTKGPLLVGSRGKITVIITKENLTGPSFRTVIYHDPVNGVNLTISGMPSAISYLLRTEFPNGVSKDFITQQLMPFLDIAFETEAYHRICNAETARILDGNIGDEAFPGEKRLVHDLMKESEVRVDQNDWNLSYTVLEPLGGLEARKFSGKLSPFSIDEVSTKILLSDAYWLNRSETRLKNAPKSGN